MMPDPRCGGDGRDRTGDLLLAKQALSQLSYIPRAVDGGPKWARTTDTRLIKTVLCQLSYGPTGPTENLPCASKIKGIASALSHPPVARVASNLADGANPTEKLERR